MTKVAEFKYAAKDSGGATVEGTIQAETKADATSLAATRRVGRIEQLVGRAVRYHDQRFGRGQLLLDQQVTR